MSTHLTDKNKLGLFTSTSLVIGNMIGAGIFLMPAALAAFGAISLWGWFFSTIGAILLAKIFSSISKLVPAIDGGPYAYTKIAFGNFIGFLVAWGYWISIWCTNAAITVSFISAMSTFFPILATNPIVAVVAGLATIWLLTWINTLGIITSGKLQLLTTILKITPLLLIAFIGIFYIDVHNFSPFNATKTNNWQALTATVTYTFFAFLGLECATIPASNVANAQKTIPKATMIGTIITASIYMVSSISIMGLIPLHILQHSVTPFADAGTIIWGKNATYFISAGVAIAAFGALNGWILIQGQIPAAIAIDKLFPSIFAKKNSKGVPAIGIIISSILVSILMCMNYTKGLVEQFKFLVLLSTLTALVPYLFCTAAYLIIKLNSQQIFTKQNWAKSIAIAFLAFIFSIWIVIGTGMETVYWGFILLLLGIPFYVFILWKNKV